jgi:hypothetical protein
MLPSVFRVRRRVNRTDGHEFEPPSRGSLNTRRELNEFIRALQRTSGTDFDHDVIVIALGQEARAKLSQKLRHRLWTWAFDHSVPKPLVFAKDAPPRPVHGFRGGHMRQSRSSVTVARQIRM